MPILEDVRRRDFEDFREFINPLVAVRASLTGEPAYVVSTDAGRLVDGSGKAIEDFHGTQAFGHRHPEVTAAVRGLLDSDGPNWFPARVNPWAGRLARQLCERTGYSNVFFANSGSGAVEATLKLARALTRRPRILSLERAYHGCTFGSCGLMSPGPFRDPFAPHLPGLSALPLGDIDAAAAALRAGDVAAVVVEPVQLEGGVRPLPEEYVAALCELTEQQGTLLVADEVQTGLGRTGNFLRSERWPRRPDCVVIGKHLGGGLMPLSAMLTRRELFERAYGANFETAEAHNMTFSGNALACAAGLATLELLTPALVASIGPRGNGLRQGLESALGGSPLFRGVRGEGLIVGIQLEPTRHPWLSFDHFGVGGGLEERPTIGPLLCHRLYRRGFFCFVCGHDWTVLRVLPRFNVEPAVLDGFIAAVREELGYLAGLD